MRVFQVFSMSAKALFVNKSRTGLTILGIVIGIAAIMVIFTSGKGAESLIVNELGGFGAETISVDPGQEPTGPTDLIQSLYSDSLKKSDLLALQNKVNVPEAEIVAPVVIVPSSASYRGETYRPTIIGTDVEAFDEMFRVPLDRGELFTQIDIQQKARLAVIGDKVRTELFGNVDPLGKIIKVDQQQFRVVGIFPKHGQIVGFDLDEALFIPWTTAQDYLLGTDYFHEIDIKASSRDVVDQAVQHIKLTLRESHGIKDPSKDDFYVTTQAGIINQIQIVLQILTIFLASVVAIALLVGGIGVMNVMLVSVTERTSEIGLRKAVGATRGNIMAQFLAEAVIITLSGGILGVTLGTALSYLLSVVLAQAFQLAWPFSFHWIAALIGTSASMVVGLIFGIYPARQASQKSPIEAMQYE